MHGRVYRCVVLGTGGLICQSLFVFIQCFCVPVSVRVSRHVYKHACVSASPACVSLESSRSPPHPVSLLRAPSPRTEVQPEPSVLESAESRRRKELCKTRRGKGTELRNAGGIVVILTTAAPRKLQRNQKSSKAPSLTRATAGQPEGAQFMSLHPLNRVRFYLLTNQESTEHLPLAHFSTVTYVVESHRLCH